MKRPLTTTLLLLAATQSASAQYAVQVISYDAGTTAAAGYDHATAPLGPPANTNGPDLFQGVISPFNPPYQSNDIISVGELGHLTLRLSNYAIPQAGVPEIGVFTHVGLADNDYPNGLADGGPTAFSIDSALVEVSENGTSWASLGNVTFDIPTNAYTDVADPFSLTNGDMLADAQNRSSAA